LIKEAIILAGGLGTRLRDTVPDMPKCMAPVAELPFLTYVIRHLLSQGIERFIFSVGYRYEVIEEFIKNQFPYITCVFTRETSPLGTGGAIRFALTETNERDILIVNGDTLFKIDVDDLYDGHMKNQAECTLALKPMFKVDRYGVVDRDDDGRITRFKEKEFFESGNINGGVYLLNKAGFLKKNFPDVFSFEKDYLEQYVSSTVLLGNIQDKYFIDIGVPSDYERAQSELKYPNLSLEQVDNGWTVFLDRDGVINYNKDESYVFHTGEFKFIPGAVEAIKRLSEVFGKIIVITNQRGIGKGLMGEQALSSIHQHMLNEIQEHGGRIDALYYCAVVDDKHPDRKPNPGMILEAAHMYPEIDLEKSIMVGDKMSDMQLGRNVGAYTVKIDPAAQVSHPDIDLACDSLINFSMRFVH